MGLQALLVPPNTTLDQGRMTLLLPPKGKGGGGALLHPLMHGPTELYIGKEHVAILPVQWNKTKYTSNT